MRKKKIRGKKYDEEEKLSHPGLHSSYTKEQATMIQPQRPPLLQILLILNSNQSPYKNSNSKTILKFQICYISLNNFTLKLR